MQQLHGYKMGSLDRIHRPKRTSGDAESLARRVSCAGGGTRQVRSDGWACECPIGLTGIYCEIDYDDCKDNECENNSTCQDLRSDYNCICMPNNTGRLCEISMAHGEEKLDVLDIVPMILNMPLPGIIVGIIFILCTLAIIKISAEKILSRNKRIQYASELSELWKRKFSKSWSRNGKKKKRDDSKSIQTESGNETTQSSSAVELRSFDLESSETGETSENSEDEIEIDKSYSQSSDATSTLRNELSKEQGFPDEQGKMTTTAVSLETESTNQD
ncbi:EGF-like domain protein [Trichuris suis]|nr:EGF-like domain protein [Trichuris suis]